ncbi:TniB family NTP-binding protein [Embleya sp. MST-111070]|uniref:TniB family NTP-binding protein n=2 Tax=Embleya sp. MST-111070 TaxID=3398231 RepID=UPI003F733094
MTVRIGWDTAVHRPATIPDLRDCAPAGTPVGDDDPRMLYHGTLGPVATADIDHGLKVARRLLRANRQTTQTPAHAAVDGERGSGKTTLLHVVGRAHQGRVEKWHGIDANRIPVVCINTPPTRDDLVNWSAQIAVFLGWDLYRRDPDGKTVQRTKDWTGPVVHVLRAAKTRLLLVDGIDRLRTGDIGPAFAFLDFLAAELGLTVLWCGTGSREVLREARGDPDTDTGTLLPRNAAPTLWVRPVPYTGARPEPWLRTLDGFDEKLRLHHHTRHDLLTHATFLHKASEGRMDVLAPLICQAAQIAIENGTEALTTAVLAEAAEFLGTDTTYRDPSPAGTLQDTPQDTGPPGGTPPETPG